MSLDARSVSILAKKFRHGCFLGLIDGPYLLAIRLRAQIGGMIEIRIESPRDWKAVYHVVLTAFGRPAEAELVKELRESGDSVVSLVAEEDGEIVGHVLLSRMEAPFAALALAPLSVIPTRQRSGIGSALVRGAVDRARTEGWAAIFVLGDPTYYERFDFDRAEAEGFGSPYAGPHFMLLKLTPSLPAAAGELRHAAAFATLA